MPGMNSLVLTLIGEDRAGLVEAVARVVAAHDGNWLESQMNRLAGKFAGILRIDVSADAEGDLIAALSQLDGLHIIVESAGSDTTEARLRPLVLDVVGADHPGIVRDITAVLAKAGANIEELTTGCIPAPMTAEPLFTAHVTLSAPNSLDLDDLQGRLEAIANDLVVEVELDDAD